MKKMLTKSILFVMLLGLFSCNKNFKPLATVDKVDLEKYSGRWYEIARLPTSFEEGLKCVTATYSIKENGKVKVINRGHKIDDPTKVNEAVGTAWRPDDETPAKLKVRFFWPFSGKYWILELDEDYQYALVGAPNREYLWILSRSKQLEETTYKHLVAQAKEKGFDTSKLIEVNQDCNN